MPYCKHSVTKLNTADMNKSTMDIVIYAHDLYCICIFSMNIVGTNSIIFVACKVKFHYESANHPTHALHKYCDTPPLHNQLQLKSTLGEL